MVETQREISCTHSNPKPMERTLDFSDVLSYDLNMNGPDVILNLFQPDITTKIRIEINKKENIDIAKDDTKQQNVSEPQQTEPRINARAKMTVEKVREIRSNWDQTVKACKTKTAAAERLAKIYGCSSKNIYAIIYKYSWASV